VGGVGGGRWFGHRARSLAWAVDLVARRKRAVGRWRRAAHASGGGPGGACARKGAWG